MSDLKPGDLVVGKDFDGSSSCRNGLPGEVVDGPVWSAATEIHTGKRYPPTWLWGVRWCTGEEFYYWRHNLRKLRDPDQHMTTKQDDEVTV